MSKLNKRQKINYGIILFLIMLITTVFVVGGQENRYFENLTVVLSINTLLVVLFELWQLKGISLNMKERNVVSMVTIFFMREGFSQEQILKLTTPYFKAYSQKKVKKTIFKSTDRKYNKYTSLSWTNISYRMYAFYIIIDILKQNGIRNKINEKGLIRLSEFIVRNAQKYKLIDYYLSSKKNINKYPLLSLWGVFKEFGILPEKNKLFLQKVINKQAKNKLLKNNLIKKAKIINSFHNKINSNYAKVEKTQFTIAKIVLLVISLVSIKVSFYFLFTLPFLFALSFMKNDETYLYEKEQLIKSKYRIPDYFEILKAELVATFLLNRYNVGEAGIVKHVSYYTSEIQRFEILNVLREKKPLKEICELINDSGYRKKTIILLLFDIAAADKVFSDKEDEYIYMVGKYLNFPRERITEIRNQYLKRGVKEKKIEQKTHQKSYSNSSSSMYSFYSSKAYKILGIEKIASADEIKKAYRALVMKHHPDKFAMQGKEAMEKAEDKFQMLTEAYELIKRLRNIK